MHLKKNKIKVSILVWCTQARNPQIYTYRECERKHNWPTLGSGSLNLSHKKDLSLVNRWNMRKWMWVKKTQGMIHLFWKPTREALHQFTYNNKINKILSLTVWHSVMFCGQIAVRHDHMIETCTTNPRNLRTDSNAKHPLFYPLMKHPVSVNKWKT